jgi:hypothetical protein
MAALEFLWLSLFQSLYNYNSRPIHSILRSYISYRFCCCCLLIKAKHQHGKYHNKNTGLFINCMDFVVVRTKINKKKIVIFFFCYAWALLSLLLFEKFLSDCECQFRVRLSISYLKLNGILNSVCLKG